LSSCWDRVEEAYDLQDDREDRLNEHLVEELLTVEVAHLVESEQSKVEELAKLTVALYVEDGGQGAEHFLYELNEDPYSAGVLEQVNGFRKDEPKHSLATETVVSSDTSDGAHGLLLGAFNQIRIPPG